MHRMMEQPSTCSLAEAVGASYWTIHAFIAPQTSIVRNRCWCILLRVLIRVVGIQSFLHCTALTKRCLRFLPATLRLVDPEVWIRHSTPRRAICGLHILSRSI